MHEEQRVGAHALEAATALLQRARRAHPTRGLYEAADLQWWWRTPRPTDELPQLFWFDELGRPAAAVIATAWGEQTALDPIVLPDAEPEVVAHVVARGLAHAASNGIGTVDVVIDRADDVMRAVLLDHGFTAVAGGSGAPSAGLSVVEAWLVAEDRPEISPLPDGYRAATRLDTMPRPHHLVGRSGPEVEARLLQTSLYRPDLDLLVLDARDDVAAYGLFWFDPETATGLVEPMRTEDDHQRRGLARHVLTAGIDRLVRTGATRIKICFEPDNDASKHLYLGVGFVPVKDTEVLTGPTTLRPAATGGGT